MFRALKTRYVQQLSLSCILLEKKIFKMIENKDRALV